ncbi:uncharacterized protein LOC142979948 [Anticarsia gemmatalis]|uniref:uncharacterized protein LOC142979948 n=1 Tax=Anticarsia gemmatalis TaxID=129554 RepID=UPI003F7678E2
MDKSSKNDKSSTNDKMDSVKESSNKSKTKNRGKKRKRRESGSSSEFEEVLPENALEMEKNLHASAVKNNLDETSVRKILKKVVTNDHVLALVKLREEEEDSGPEENSLRPKLTRAKVKELMKVSPKAAAWNLENLELTPIKHIPVKTRPEVKALIAQELPDDEDDDEYEPTHEDVPSDDDQGLESCSDLDSQPRTPATPRSLHTTSPKVVQDGPFKVPLDVSTPTRRKLDLEEEATIALRTRSKLSLSSTSIEHIESTFVPPDDLPMPAVDDLWNQFLNECLNPASTSKHEDDDETDPEYNVAADPDAHDEDEETLSNSIIKISKKELNDLVTELFNIMPEAAADDDLMADNLASSVLTEHSQQEISGRWEGKQEPMSDEDRRANLSDRITFEKRSYTRFSIGKSEPPDPPEQTLTKKSKSKEDAPQQNSVVDIAIEEREDDGGGHMRGAPPLLQRHLRQPKTQCVTIQVDNGLKILPEQVAILQQQLRQHIQLATSNYLQLYIHPVHWSMAPTYKEYLESLSKLCESNPKSVARVCNLQPALELVKTWESTVSANTPENKEMVEFIHRESERCRRRFSNKSLYVGEFHSTFLSTVANSGVFLYPHLLPPMPYRADHTRRYSYTRAEDALIALGLDQFWDYVENNPAMFKLKPVPNPRHRPGYVAALTLVVKHMFPWIPYKILSGHIQFVRKSANDKDNPINKLFESRTITPVCHRLLPYNPRLSLYEQPEHEVPRIWIRYLAKTSKRFRNHLLRRTNVTGMPPTGIEIHLGDSVKEPTKAPLPIDFTKEIVSNRINILPKTPKPTLADKFDVHITKPVAVNLFKLVETSTGSYLVPLDNVTTVNSSSTPISTPAEVRSQIIDNDFPESSKSDSVKIVQNDKDHCTCCVALRKICKRQTTILEYFSRNTTKSCYCKDIKFVKITNRLRMLVNNYKETSQSALHLLGAMLKNTKNYKDDATNGSASELDDFMFVTSFNLKLLTRATNARDSHMKRRLYNVLSKFDPDSHDPIQLAKSMYETLRVELVDMYKEFLCFLTPEQADKCDMFRSYFVRNCLQDLLKKVETEITNDNRRMKVVRKLHGLYYNNLMSACEMCTDLLADLHGYPQLAQHVFSLFPHRKDTGCEQKAVSSPDKNTGNKESGSDNRETHNVVTQDRSMEYEADHSASEEETNNENNQSNDGENSDSQGLVIKTEISTSDNEISVFANNKVSTRHDSRDSSNHSMTIVFEDDPIKPETAEWKRDEDKLILEVLKEHLTPEERKDKTILELIEEKNIIDMIADSLIDKSKDDVKGRVLYLLQMLVLSEK